MVINICKVCRLEKEEVEFYKSNKATCKDCVKKRNNDNYKKLGNGYDNTFKGVIRVLYKTMKRSQRLRGFEDIPFTKKDFTSWLLNNNFEYLYNKWVYSGYNKGNKPSVDRLDDYEGYVFTNMRLVTWTENRDHQIHDRLTGNSKSGEVCISVQKLSSSGDVLKEYTSYSEVRREEGYCVHYAIKTEQPCKMGYHWRIKK